MEKIALVTGANRGIGFETARQLAQQGVHVIVAARDRDKAVAATLRLQTQGLSAEALRLDVTGSASITSAVQEVGHKHGRLDILVNNAGIIAGNEDARPSTQSLEVWRRIFETNLFGLVETTLAFLPLLRRSSAGRIVNVSSILGSIAAHQTPGSPIYGFLSVPAYSASKAAVNSFTVQLAEELKDTPIKVNAIHPGYVKTDMNHGNGELDIPDGAKTSVEMALIPADGPTGSFTHVGATLPW
jgi:NAD(P)-dependent dehydrogenase (short-subunit alcohol dehydrogenase family)